MGDKPDWYHGMVWYHSLDGEMGKELCQRSRLAFDSLASRQQSAKNYPTSRVYTGTGHHTPVGASFPSVVCPAKWRFLD